jgi:Arabinose efflux permease
MVDRVARHRLMMWCDVLRALVVGSVPLAWLLGLLTLPQLHAVVLATGVLTVFSDVACQSYLPVLLDERSLVDGNGKLGITGSAAGMLGSTIAGGLVAAVGAAQAVLVNAFSYVVSAVSLLLIRTPEPKPAPPPGPRPALRRQIGEGLRFVLTHPILKKIVACTGTVNLFVTMVLSMEMPFLVRVLHLAPETAGLLLALGASGGVLGGLLAGRLSRAIGSARIIWVAPLLFGLPGLCVPLAGPGWRVLLYAVGWFSFNFTAVVYNTAQLSYGQTICPPELLGGMNAAVRWIVWGTIPLGALIAGGLATWLGLRATLWIGVTGTCLAGFLVFFSPLRHMRDIETGRAAAGS